MSNVTIALGDKTLKAGRDYARTHDTTLNDLIRELLTQVTREGSTDWAEECIALMNRAKARSGGRRWRREDLYDV